MAGKVVLFKGGLEEYPKSLILLGNLLMVFWIVLGTVACWFFSPIVAVAYLVVAVLMVYVVLRKLVCTNCYYYDKWCVMGWGKLSALMFPKGKIERFNEGAGVKMAPLVYGLLTIVPLVLLVVSTLQYFTPYKLVVLVLLLLVSFYSGGASRKATCAKCKMNLYCKGSAEKQTVKA